MTKVSGIIRNIIVVIYSIFKDHDITINYKREGPGTIDDEVLDKKLREQSLVAWSMDIIKALEKDIGSYVMNRGELKGRKNLKSFLMPMLYFGSY